MQTKRIRVNWNGANYEGETFEEVKTALLSDPRVDDWEMLIDRAICLYPELKKFRNADAETVFTQLDKVGEVRITRTDRPDCVLPATQTVKVCEDYDEGDAKDAEAARCDRCGCFIPVDEWDEHRSICQ